MKKELLGKIKKYVKERIKKDKSIIALVILAVIVLIGIIVGANAGKINVEDYVNVTVDGYNTRGTARVCLKTELDEEVYKQLNINTDTFEGAFQADNVEDKIDHAVKLEIVGKTEGLKNGDTVVVKITIDQELVDDIGVNMKGEKFTYEVSGLEVVPEKDVFKDLEVHFEGAAPKAYAVVEYKGDVEGVSDERFSTGSNRLSNGDKVTITYDANRDDNFIAKEKSRQYICENVDEYIMSLKNLDERKLTALKNTAKKCLEERFNDRFKEYIKYTALKYEGCYMRKVEYLGDEEVRFDIIYSAVMESKDNNFKKTKVYLPVEIIEPIYRIESPEEVEVNRYNGVKRIGLETDLLITDYCIPDAYVQGYKSGVEMFEDLIKNDSDVLSYEVSDSLKQFGE